MSGRGPLRAATYRPRWDGTVGPARPSERQRAASADLAPTTPPTDPTWTPDARRPSSDTWVLAAGAGYLLALLGFVAGGVLWRSDMFAGLLVTPVLALVVHPLARALGRACPSFDATSIVHLGLAAKLIGVQVRYYVIEGVYGGVADSTGYDEWGRRLASQFLDFDFTADVDRSILGTGFLRYLSGLVYALVGSHQFAAFCVFGFFAFLGVLGIFRAVVMAVPEADHRRYALLVFLWPSLLFWPASVGKESWVLLCLGVATYGAARLLTIRAGGFVLVGAGLAGIVMVRPHVAILFGAALVPAYFLRRGGGLGPVGPAAKIVGLLVLLVGFAMIAAQAERFFGFEDLDVGSVNDALEETQSRTTQGGSAYDPVVVRNPLDYPWAVVTVLVRPFPTEADNGQMLFTSLEAFVLLLLLAVSAPRLASVPRLAARRPFVVLAVLYVAMFCFAFAAMGNFGILARQRVQMLPFLFVLVSLPASVRSKSSVDEADDPVTDAEGRGAV